MIASLSAAGYVLGVVSNRQSSYAAELDDLGLSSHLRFSLAAGEVGAFKPDPEIFRRALALAGTAAHETIYLGDNYFADVVGSRPAGLLPV
jgi:putative hydrolase of the HAD superfamily